ncbi:MAG TPA: hypothetical protein VMX15_00880 [Candidatus Heimdallarchaeota archaeon]|nr:hypothetical protein [Candidatus Heimdallarchaeota archaeon]
MALTQRITDLEQLQTQRIGYMAVSLTNYDNDLEPEIAEGSVLEIGGAVYEAAADEPITGWGGIGNSNDVYILIDAGTLGAVFTLVAPTWSTTKQGWYDGLDRYVGKLYKDGAGAYTLKRVPYPRRVAAIRVAEELASDVVEMAKIKDLAVTTGKIADAAVTAAKIADGVVNKNKLGPWAAPGSSGALGVGEVWGTVEGILCGSVTAGSIVLDFGGGVAPTVTGAFTAVEGIVIKGGGAGGTFYMRRLWA